MSEEQPTHNTYLLDTESAAEMGRLVALDRFTTQAMGGPFAGISDPSSLRSVVDLGCGPGGWVLDVAFAYPDIDVAGVDVSQTMTEYARARALTQQLPNATFGVMDISQPLDFSDATFDLVNARFLVGALPQKVWKSFVAECTRILRPGGILRLTESNDTGNSTSAAFERLSWLLSQAMRQRGYGFSSDGRNFGITSVLPRMLREAGFQQVRLIAHALDVSAKTDAWADFYRNYEVAYSLAQPLLHRLATPEEVQQLYQQMLIEMHLPDFSGAWQFMSAIGQKPEESE